MNWLRLHFREKKFDLMHCHFGNIGFWALSLKKHLKIPMVTMFYGYDATMLPSQEPVWYKRYLKLFNTGQIFLVEGNHMKKTLMTLGCPEEKIKIFHLGVNMASIPFQTKCLQNGETLKILAAGAFREKKGFPYAIEAFAMAKKEYPNMKLTIIGDSFNNDEIGAKEKQRILDCVNRYGIKDSIAFLGFQPHKRFIEELQKHHLFISPSIRAENGDAEGGSPVSITEASAAGLPVISTFHCDIPEVVLHGKTGLLSVEKDVIALKENILFFVKNQEAIIEFGRNGRKHIENEYNLNKQLINLGDIYKSLIER